MHFFKSYQNYNFKSCVFKLKLKPIFETYVQLSEHCTSKSPKVAILVQKLNLNPPGFLKKIRF